MTSYQLQRFENSAIINELIQAAAKLLSENYGIGGPLAAEKMRGVVKRGMLRIPLFGVAKLWFFMYQVPFLAVC